MTTQLKYGSRVQVEPGTYPVNDLYLSIQGEGAHTGNAAIFLRLQGCNVGCPFCDTRETWAQNGALASKGLAGLAESKGKNGRYAILTAQEIADACRGLTGADNPLVVITGGEPALYPLGDLAVALRNAGFTTSLETSGTALGMFLDPDDIDPFPGGAPPTPVVDWLTVSPKYDMAGGLQVSNLVLEAADEIKLVIGKEGDLERARELKAMFPRALFYLQPMSMSPKATLLCIEEVKRGVGFKLSAQLHNYLNLP